MHIPLVVDERNTKWKLLGEILKIFDSRSVKQEIAKQGIKPIPKAGVALRTVLIAMFFSQDISYVVDELMRRKRLRILSHIPDPLSAQQIYSFLSRFTEEQFIELVLKILNTLCHKRSRGRAKMFVDSTDIHVDLNWFRKKITKADLEEKEFKWAYSPSKGYYIGYKLTIAIEYPSMKSLAFLLHQGSPNDARLYDEIMMELKRRRVAKGSDIVIFDKGYYSYENYVKGISLYKVVPLIFPKKNFSLDRALGMMSYPLSLYLRKGQERERLKAFFNDLIRIFKEEITNWEKFRPLRSLIEDVFKLAKSFFPNGKIHRYTQRSVQKYVSLSVLLVGILVSIGINGKEDLQRFAEW